jgi:hypothetical protein
MRQLDYCRVSEITFSLEIEGIFGPNHESVEYFCIFAMKFSLLLVTRAALHYHVAEASWGSEGEGNRRLGWRLHDSLDCNMVP